MQPISEPVKPTRMAVTALSRSWPGPASVGARFQARDPCSRPALSQQVLTTYHTEAATEQHGQHGIVSLGAHAIAVGSFQDFRALICTEPIARAKPELLDPLHSADACGQFGAEQPRIGGFVSEAAKGCELLVDGVGGQPA